MTLWSRLFGKGATESGTRATTNVSRSSQWPSNVGSPQQAQSRSTSATRSAGIVTMVKVCSNHRSRLLSLEDDPLFKEAIEQLTREGPSGGQALAGLIDELLAARCAEIEDALTAATRLPPRPELLNVLERVIAAPPVINGQPGRFSPVIVGGGKIGWDDGTSSRIKEQASEALASLRAK